MKLVTEIVRDRERFAALREAWDALAISQSTPLAHHAWYSAVLAAQPANRCRLEIILIWEGDCLAAAAPLMHDTSLSPGRLVPIDAIVGEPDRLLYNSPAALDALALACARLRRPILFRRLSASTADLAAVTQALRSSAPVFCRPLHASAAVNLPTCFENFEASMSTGRRSTIRRKWRAAEREHGGIEAKFIAARPFEVAAHIARIEAIESAGWKGRAGTALSADPQMRGIVTHVAEEFAGWGGLLLAYLKFGNQDAACRLILRQGPAWFEIKIGYDESFARFSPGLLLMHETLREACRTGIRSYAFLGLREGWQDHWPHQVIQDYRLASYPLSVAGGLALAADGIQAAASLVRRLRR